MRLIDADKLADYRIYRDASKETVHLRGIPQAFIAWSRIKKMPTYKQEERCGEWVTDTQLITEIPHCSACLHTALSVRDSRWAKTKYCPFCGAKMKE
jgi:hypothetical protein